MKRRIKRIVTFLIAGVFMFTGIAGNMPLNAKAADDTWGWDEIIEFIEKSNQLVHVIEKFDGIKMDFLYSFAEKGEDFFDIPLKDILARFDVPEDYEVEEEPISNRQDTELYISQMEVLEKATNESFRRGLIGNQWKQIKDDWTYQQEYLCMFFSHYVDGPGGNDMYYSKYGYQNQFMADWLSDEDRKVYIKYIDGIDKSDRVQSMATLLSCIYDAYSAVSGVSDATGDILKTLSWVLTMTDTAGSIYEELKDLNWGRLMKLFKESVDESELISEVESTLFRKASTEFEYLTDLAKDVAKSICSLLLFGIPIAAQDIVPTFIFAAINLAGDSYFFLNNTALALTRNIRVAHRVSDYMEYHGYW